MIFLGGQAYADLLRPAIPHPLAPLSGGMGDHRGLCRRAREESTFRDTWWNEAANLHTEHHQAEGD